MQNPIVGGKIDEESERRPPRIGTVSATISILRLLASQRNPLGVNAIARQLNLSPSSCFNILKTLASEDFVEFNPHTKTYSPGSGIVALARRSLDPNAAFELIRGKAEPFADEWKLTVGLWRVGRQRIVLTGYAVSSTTTRIHLTIGQRLPRLIGGAGRCVAAWENLPREQLEAEFNKLQWQEPLSFETYLQEVERARIHGWAMDHGYLITGATSMATGIKDADGDLCYCLTATMFTGQHDPDKFPVLAREMQEIAEWASVRLSPPKWSPFADRENRVNA